MLDKILVSPKNVMLQFKKGTIHLRMVKYVHK